MQVEGMGIEQQEKAMKERAKDEIFLGKEKLQDSNFGALRFTFHVSPTIWYHIRTLELGR